MSWNVQGSMRCHAVPTAPGMLDSEPVAGGILRAEGAILGLFHETSLQDPQGMAHMENRVHHHGYHALLEVDPMATLMVGMHSGLLIAPGADMLAAEGVHDVVYIVSGKPTALNVVTAVTLTIVNFHGTGSAASHGHPRPIFGLT